MFCMFCGFTRPIYQVSVYRTIGSLVIFVAHLLRRARGHKFCKNGLGHMTKMAAIYGAQNF